MAFNDSFGKHVRAVAHPHILISLVMVRPAVQRLLIAYTVDLISVLRELFDITLRPELALTTTWTELKEAFETYERSFSRQRIHNNISSKTPRGEQMLTADDISKKVRDLLEVQL